MRSDGLTERCRTNLAPRANCWTTRNWLWTTRRSCARSAEYPSSQMVLSPATKKFSAVTTWLLALAFDRATEIAGRFLEAEFAPIEVRRLSGDTSWDTGAPAV